MKIHLRTLIKCLSWEGLGVIIMFFYCYFTKTSYKIIWWYFLIRVLIYYPFHRLFKNVDFRKVLRLKIENE
jgi:hypothetical protein